MAKAKNKVGKEVPRFNAASLPFTQILVGALLVLLLAIYSSSSDQAPPVVKTKASSTSIADEPNSASNEESGSGWTIPEDCVGTGFTCSVPLPDISSEEDGSQLASNVRNFASAMSMYNLALHCEVN